MIECKILILMPLLKNPITGGEIYNRKLFEFLKSRYANVENISWNTRPHSSNLQFLLNSFLQNLSFLKILRKVHEKTIIIEDISSSEDLFLFNFAAKRLIWIWGKEVRIVPIVHHVYASLMKGKLRQNFRVLVEKVFLNSSDAIIANSEFTRISVEAISGDRKGIVVAYPGLNTSSGGKSRFSKIEKADMHLLFVGQICPRKGVDTLIEAFRILVFDYGIKNIKLDLAGDVSRDPDFFCDIRCYCDAIMINDQVCFHGRVTQDKLEELYSQADIFVLPSLWEGFGMVLIEAMSYHLPIVATNAGAIPYLVKDGENGFLVPIKNPEKLAQSLKRLVDFPGLRLKIGESNYHLALEFNWNNSFTKIERFLDMAFD
ncbi:MAG: glycosyltransferase family 4 protein [Methanotrichaceae archaeon]|nr:glycosyltransferase family 4 protein [Methanotrichaceae archaeon]